MHIGQLQPHGHLALWAYSTMLCDWDAGAHRQQMTASTPAALAQHSTFLSISQSRCLMAWWLPSTHFRCATSVLRQWIFCACTHTFWLIPLHVLEGRQIPAHAGQSSRLNFVPQYSLSTERL